MNCDVHEKSHHEFFVISLIEIRSLNSIVSMYNCKYRKVTKFGVFILRDNIATRQYQSGIHHEDKTFYTFGGLPVGRGFIFHG